MPKTLAALLVVAMLATTALAEGPEETPNLATPTHYTTVLDQLAQRYGEYPVVKWVDPQGHLVVVTVNPDTGTSSLLVISGDGKILSATGGVGFEVMRPVDTQDA